MPTSRLRISEDELKDIKPDTALYARAKKLFRAVKEGEPYVEYARKHLHRSGELEFDDDAVASISDDDGAYVMAWKWIADEDMREAGYLKEKDADEENNDGKD